MSDRPVDGDRSSIRPALGGLVPYEPGKPVEEVQRELGLERVVKLASNEGPYGPFPAAQDAIARTSLELNRYPDGGAWRLRQALAVRHGVGFENVTVCAGADAVIGFACMATLDPGDEAITGWPSFPSYVLDPLKLGGVSVRVPLRDERFDLDAILAAITARTKLVFIAAPNNPTGTTSNRAELDSVLCERPAARADGCRPGVPRVHRGSRLPGCDRGVRTRRPQRARPAHVLEDLRTGRPPGRVRRRAGGRDHGDRKGSASLRRELGRQEAALASLADHGEIARRRIANREAMTALDRALRSHGLDPAGPAVANFLFVRVGDAAGGQRRAASAGSHRPSVRPVRGSGRSPDHRRYAGRDRLPRARARGGISCRRPQGAPLRCALSGRFGSALARGNRRTSAKHLRS